jgi:hypothetical protein
MRGLLIFVWSLIDPYYFYCTRLTYPPYDGDGGNIFRVRLTKYRGKSVVLSDGTRINKNDTLVKIHLHNARLLKEFHGIKSEIKKAKLIYRYVQKSLPGVEQYIRNQTQGEKIKGIIGITSLNKGCERLGFDVIDISHPIYKWFKRFAFLTIGVLSNRNNSILHILVHQQPIYLFMSSKQLTNLYRNGG